MICIIPSVKTPYKNQFEFSVDIKLINLLKKIYKIETKILSEKSKLSGKCKLLVISGGNSILKLSKRKNDLIRHNLDKFYFTQALKRKIPIIGICHGAQFISSYFSSSLKKINNHVGDHDIIYKGKIYRVNSFHKIGIIRLGKNLIKTSEAMDKSIESFKHKSLNIKGIVWHPERHKFIKKIDKLVLDI